MSNVITLVENQNNFTLTATVQGDDGLLVEAVWNGQPLGTASFGYHGEGAQESRELTEHDKVFLIAQGTQEIANMFPVRAMVGEIEITALDMDELRADMDAFADYINQAIDELNDSE